MSKILIEGNKVIIDGHANDLETCNTLTNLCDELSTSEKFRTVKYESGYGEFESVSDNEEKKFDDPDPINGYQVNIQSNDGATILAQNNSIDFVVVTSNGVQLKRGYTVIVTYTYSGSKLFAGLATSANATVPKYKPGDTIAITAETTLYIVENIIIPDHHRSLTELFTNIAAVIREKTGSTEPIIADAFPTAIDAIPSGGGGAGFKVTFPDTATNWGRVDSSYALILLADGTIKSVEDYSTIGGKTIENVAAIQIKSSYEMFVLRMTLSAGGIAQFRFDQTVNINLSVVTTAPNATPTPYNAGRHMFWWPVADTVISAIEMYNTD